MAKLVPLLQILLLPEETLHSGERGRAYTCLGEGENGVACFLKFHLEKRGTPPLIQRGEKAGQSRCLHRSKVT